MRRWVSTSSSSSPRGSTSQPIAVRGPRGCEPQARDARVGRGVLADAVAVRRRRADVDAGGRVVVDAQPVGGALHEGEVAVAHDLRVVERGREGAQPLVVRAVDERAEPDPVVDRVDAVGGLGRLGALRPHRRQVEHDAHGRRRRPRAAAAAASP